MTSVDEQIVPSLVGDDVRLQRPGGRGFGQGVVDGPVEVGVAAGAIERLPVVMDWGEISGIASAAVIMSYLATIYPAVTAAQHHPVEGLRDD